MDPKTIAEISLSEIAERLDRIESRLAGSPPKPPQVQPIALRNDLSRVSAQLEVCIGNNTILMEAINRSLGLNNRKLHEITKMQKSQGEQLERLQSAVDRLQSGLDSRGAADEQ